MRGSTLLGGACSGTARQCLAQGSILGHPQVWVTRHTTSRLSTTPAKVCTLATLQNSYFIQATMCHVMLATPQQILQEQTAYMYTTAHAHGIPHVSSGAASMPEPLWSTPAKTAAGHGPQRASATSAGSPTITCRSSKHFQGSTSSTTRPMQGVSMGPVHVT